MYMCSYEEIGKAISDEVEQGFLNEWIIFTGKYQGLRPMTFQNIVATQMGTCLEKSTYKIAALRANGIPAALNMVPCWGNSQYPHSWVEIIGSKQFGMIYDNTQRPFLTKDDIKIDGMFWRDVYQSKIDMFPSDILLFNIVGLLLKSIGITIGYNPTRSLSCLKKKYLLYSKIRGFKISRTSMSYAKI